MKKDPYSGADWRKQKKKSSLKRVWYTILFAVALFRGRLSNVHSRRSVLVMHVKFFGFKENERIKCIYNPESKTCHFFGASDGSAEDEMNSTWKSYDKPRVIKD